MDIFGFVFGLVLSIIGLLLLAFVFLVVMLPAILFMFSGWSVKPAKGGYLEYKMGKPHDYDEDR